MGARSVKRAGRHESYGVANLQPIDATVVCMCGWCSVPHSASCVVTPRTAARAAVTFKPPPPLDVSPYGPTCSLLAPWLVPADALACAWPTRADVRLEPHLSTGRLLCSTATMARSCCLAPGSQGDTSALRQEDCRHAHTREPGGGGWGGQGSVGRGGAWACRTCACDQGWLMASRSRRQVAREVAALGPVGGRSELCAVSCVLPAPAALPCFAWPDAGWGASKEPTPQVLDH